VQLTTRKFIRCSKLQAVTEFCFLPTARYMPTIFYLLLVALFKNSSINLLMPPSLENNIILFIKKINSLFINNKNISLIGSYKEGK